MECSAGGAATSVYLSAVTSSFNVDLQLFTTSKKAIMCCSVLLSAAKLSVQMRIAGGENELHACHAGRFRCVLYLTEWEIMRPFCGIGNALNVAIKKYFVSTAPFVAGVSLLRRRKSDAAGRLKS